MTDDLNMFVVFKDVFGNELVRWNSVPPSSVSFLENLMSLPDALFDAHEAFISRHGYRVVPSCSIRAGFNAFHKFKMMPGSLSWKITLDETLPAFDVIIGDLEDAITLAAKEYSCV